jgi:hypothetical protein
MNIIIKRLLTASVSILLIGYVGFQAYCAFYNPIKTIRASSGTFEDIIKTDGFVLHAETVIESDQSGVIDYTRNDGENVAKGGEVASVYNSEKDAANERRIKALTQQIEQYEETGNSKAVDVIDINVLSSEIEKSFLSLSAAADSADIENINSIKSDMLSYLNKKQLATGEVSDFSKQTAALKKERDELSRKSAKKVGTIYAPEAGYFVSSTDGLENAYDFSKALTISAKDVKNLLEAKTSEPKNTVGKIISGYESYIVCNFNDNDVYKIHVGDTVKMRFLLSSQPEVDVTVAAINKSADGTAVVFKCTVMTSAIASIRRQTVEIVAGTYTGIQVPDNIIHIINGTKGVFVRSGDIARFKKIEPVYSAAGYTVSALNYTDSDYLQVYDEVIENGDDLYDGKIIK